MSSQPLVASDLIVMAAIATIIVIASPFILGLIARQRLRVGWKYFWFGML